MQRIGFDIEKKELDLKVRFSKAKENKTFCEIARKLDLNEEVLRKYTTSLEESAKEFENCKTLLFFLLCLFYHLYIHQQRMHFLFLMVYQIIQHFLYTYLYFYNDN